MFEELSSYGEVFKDYNLKNYNTFRIESICGFLVLPDTFNKIQELLKYLKEKSQKYIILGNGSNVILNNDLKEYVVICLSKLNAIEIHKEYNMIYVEAGAMLPKVASYSIENSLTGLEFAIGIPGSMGGSIVANAGAYNSQLMDYVKSVTVLNKDLEIVNLEHEDIKYDYRYTMFKDNKDYIILSAKLFLKEGNKEESLKLVSERKQRRVDTQPLEYPSAGSVFRNPVGDAAGRLIEICGLKGYKINGAEVSTKHANFIINTKGATSSDIRKLIKIVHDTVLEKTGVDLIEEQEFIG